MVGQQWVRSPLGIGSGGNELGLANGWLPHDHSWLLITCSALWTPNAELRSARSPEPTAIMVWNNMPAFSALCRSCRRFLHGLIISAA